MMVEFVSSIAAIIHRQGEKRTGRWMGRRLDGEEVGEEKVGGERETGGVDTSSVPLALASSN